MPRFPTLAAALAASMLCAPAIAAEAKVVWSDPSCQYFIADLGGKFGMYNWRAGAAPKEGDLMQGDTEAGGLAELTNVTQQGKNMAIAMAISPTIHSLIHSSPVDCERRWKTQ